MRKNKRTGFNAGKDSGSAKKKAGIAVFIVFLIAGLGFGAFFGARLRSQKLSESDPTRSVFFCEPAFDEAPLAGIGDVKYYTGGLAVYTEGGKSGLLSLDGTKATGAEYTSFSSVSEGWQNEIFIASPVGQAFPRTVNVGEKKVDKKQYSAGENAGRTARWNDKLNALTAYDSLGSAGEIKPEDLCLYDGLYAVQGGDSSGGKYGYVDENLTMIIKPAFDAALDFSGGAGAVCRSGKWGFVDETGTEIIAPRFSSVGAFTVSGRDYCFGFRCGAAPVLENGKMGIIAKDGKTVVDFVYDVILPGEGGKFIAKKDGKWGIITLAKLPEAEEENPEEQTSAGGLYTVNTAKDPLNVRSEPHTGAPVVGKVPKGQQVTVSRINGSWARVSYGSIEGWAAIDFLVPAEQ